MSAAKVILSPTDLQVESLNTLKLALKANTGVSLSVILMYPCFLPDSITELLFYSPSRLLAERQPAEFRSALQILKNSCSNQLISLQVKPYHGNSVHALKNYLQANRVAEIYLPRNYALKIDNERALREDLINSAIPLHYAEWEPNTPGSPGQLNALFNV